MQIDQMQHGAWFIYTVCQFYPPPAHLRYLTVSGTRYVWHVQKDRSRRTKSLILSSQRRADGLGTFLGEALPTDSPHFWCGCHATHMDPDQNMMQPLDKTLCNACTYNYDHIIIIRSHGAHATYTIWCTNTTIQNLRKSSYSSYTFWVP
jgi:hypothetical protein